MARLPGPEQLSGPLSLRSGRQYSSADTGAVARGLQAAGEGLGSLAVSLRQNDEKTRRETTALEATRSDGGFSKSLSDFERGFDQDGDFATYGKRFDEGAKKLVDTWSKTITDPKSRELWVAQANERLVGARNRVITRGQGLAKEAQLVEAKAGLQGYQSVIADADASQDERDYAKRNAEASIGVLQSEGLLTPAEADTWRTNVIKGGDFVRLERNIERQGSAAISGKLPAAVNERAGMAMSYFQSQGYTKEQAAGIVGNLIAESKLDPNVAPGDNGTAHGIAQWRGERLTRLQRFANSQGKDWKDFGTQLAFVDMELKNHETGAYAALKNAKTVDEATAAFIGYERPQGWSVGNPRGGHNYKGRLTFAAQAAGETIRPDGFENLTPEQQFALEQRGAAQDQANANDEATRRTVERNQAYDNFQLRIADDASKVTRDEILNAPLLDNGQRASLLNSWTSKMDEGIAVSKGIQQFAAGALRVDPFDEKGRKLVDGVYDTAIKASGAANAQPLAEEVVRQTGVVPKAAFNSIRAGIQSTDTAEVAASLQAAQRISTVNPAALARRDGGAEVQKAADDFSHYVNDLNLAPEQAARRIMEANDPAKQRDRKALEPAAKEFLKSMQDTDLASAFDDSLMGWRSNPSLGVTQGQELGIKADFLAIAESEFYQANGDPDIAQNRAMEQMKRLYGVSDVTGSRVVMKHPPERYWPPEKGFGRDAYGYIKDQIYQDYKDLFPDDVIAKQYRDLLGEGSFIAAGSAKDIDSIRRQWMDANMAIVSTPQTDAMVKRGEMPAYSILFRDFNGMYQTLPGKLFQLDATPMQERRIDDARDAQALNRNVIEGVPNELQDAGMQGNPLMSSDPAALESQKTPGNP